MIKTYKILSLLLSYPTEELQKFLPEAMRELPAEKLLGEKPMKETGKFAAHFGQYDLVDWQAEYVQLFDTGRSVSLYLFEHLKGDSKDRGQAMVDLTEEYRKWGMELTSDELPDYLPVMLEFLSSLEPDEASEMLSGTVNVISLINQRLAAKENIYRHLTGAVISLSAKAPEVSVDSLPSAETAPEDPDRDYEEPVTFTDANTCFKCK
jgi:nitrate reductase delta subunit